MKFGESSDAINAISFNLSRGWSGPDNAEGERKIIHTFTDKSLELLDYGARIRQIAEFTLLDISKQNYFDLINFLDLKQGLPVKIEEQNTGENIFTEANTLTTYYVYITEFDQLGEVDFSTTRQRFTVSLKVVLIGELSTSRQNIEDSSLIDVLIKIDTLRAPTTQPLSPILGDRWFDYPESKLKIYDGTDWKTAYTVPQNEGLLGFYFGVFYWSLFSDVTYKTTTPDDMENDYMSGMIIKGSLDMPKKSIRISDGPNIAYKNGFSFKVRNNDKFWNFITSQGINLFGAKVTLYLYNVTGGTPYVQKIATGLNNKNNFGYLDYDFECEPITLNSDPKFNNSVIKSTNARYTEINPDKANKPPYRTFGRWEYAKLQDVSISESILNIRVKGATESEFSESFKFTAYTDRTILTDGKYKTLYVYKTGTGKDLAEFTADQITKINDSQQYSISFLYDSKSGTDNKNKIHKILSIVDNTTFYTITLNGALQAGDDNAGARPSTNDNLAVVIRQNGYQYQIDENQCGGFKVIQNGEYVEGLKVYGLNDAGTGLEEMPSTGISKNAENNKIILSPETTSEKTKADIYNNITYKGVWSPPRINEYPEAKLSVNSVSFGALFAGTFWNYGFNHQLFWWSIHDQSTFLKSSITVNNKQPSLNNYVKICKISIDHTTDDQNFLKSKSVKLCVKVSLASYLTTESTHPTSTNARKQKIRNLPAGFSFHLRAKKYDGTYIYGSSLGVNWSHEIGANKLDIYKSTNGKYENKGVLTINNFPDDGGEFGEVTTLTDNWNHFLIAKSTDRASRIGSDYFHRSGDRYFIENQGGASYIDGLQINNITNVWTDDIAPLVNGQIVMINDPVNDYGSLAGQFGDLKAKKVTGTSPKTLVTAVEGVDFNFGNPYGGKDMFDLSPLFGDAYTWDTIEQLELFFANEEFDDYIYSHAPDAKLDKNAFYKWVLDFGDGIRFGLYSVTEKELINRPLYISCDGEALDSDGVLDTTSTYPMKLGPIFKNIARECYGTSLNEASLDALALVRNMNWRKQFYDTQGAESALKDMLLSSWAVAFFDKDDKLNIKSLNEKDYPTPTKVFNDAKIISIGQVKMRNADEIYQKYKIKYDFNPPGIDSQKIDKYKSQFYVDKNSTDIDSEMKLNLQRSSNLFLNENAFEKELDYIYSEADAKRIMQYIVNWFVYNSWEVSIDVSLSNILNGNTLEIMDYVKLNTFYHTNSLDVYGFITEIKPSIYEGKISLTVYIPRPKGQLGPYGDPFNDALFLSTRDISTWTGANGKQNDSGRISTRTIGAYTQKDAGRISTRNLND